MHGLSTKVSIIFLICMLKYKFVINHKKVIWTIIYFVIELAPITLIVTPVFKIL